MALDKFLKSNKLEITYFKNVKIDCFEMRDSVSCRVFKTIASVLS